MRKVLKSLKYDVEGDTYLFIDNIEYVKNWGSILKYSCKYQRHITVFVAVKKSNKYMNDDLREILGYHCEIEVFPFSYKEYLEYYKINPNPKINNLNEKELFEEYQQYGGLPEVLETEDISYKYQIINWAYENTRNQNIYKLYFISFAKSLTKRLIETTGETFSTKIFQKFVNQDSWRQYDMFDLSYDLLLHYYSIITRMDIIKRCGNIDLVEDKFIMDEYKHYVSDPSFFALCRYSQINSKEMLESIIYMEFLRRNFNVARGIINNEEITFVHNNFLKGKTCIQFEKSLKDEKIRNKTFNKLIQMDDSSKYVVSTDTKDYSQDDITHINLLEFLKDENLITKGG